MTESRTFKTEKRHYTWRKYSEIVHLYHNERIIYTFTHTHKHTLAQESIMFFN